MRTSGLGRLLIELVVYGASIAAAAWLVPGVHLASDGVGSLAWVALLFLGVHHIVRPAAAMVTCLFYVLTLGLFHFVINALMLMLTAWLAGDAFDVDGFWAALLGSVVVSLASGLLHAVLGDPNEPSHADVVVVRR